MRLPRPEHFVLKTEPTPAVYFGGGCATISDFFRRPTTAADIAVVCAYVTQAAAIPAILSDHPDLLIGTANQLQGLDAPPSSRCTRWPGTATPPGASAPTPGGPA